MITRFAPSPTGLLHLGHAASALHGWQAARAAGGRFLLRIEDIDATRCRPEFTAAIIEDLRWLGLDWSAPVRVQSEHFSEYRAALDLLDRRGLLYPCFCTRAEIAAAPHGPDDMPRYPGTCRTLSAPERATRIAAGHAYGLRLDTAAACACVGALSFHERGVGRMECQPARFGDVMLARKDIPASYHLCVTHDDALQGVTLVTRGVDLFAVTDLHVLLQALFGWPTPEYAHHALLTDAQGKRLAKRDKALTLRALREAGNSPEAVRAMAIGKTQAAIVYVRGGDQSG